MDFSYYNKFGVAVEISNKNAQMPSMHAHKSYEIYVLISGTKSYFIESDFFNVNAGEVVLISSEKLHKTGGFGCYRALISFSDEFLKKYFTPTAINQLLECFNKNHVKPTKEQFEEILRLINVMQKNQAEKIEGDAFLHLAEILKILKESPEAVKSVIQTKGYTNKIIEYVNNNYNTISGLKDVAEKFYVNKSYLCRLFKRETGMQFTTFLNKIKLRNAVNYLLNSNKSISEISYLVGFSTSAYFCNLFKKEYNLTPHEYKKQNSLNAAI